MKLDLKKLLFGLAMVAGVSMMTSCNNDEGFDPGGEGQGKETPEPTETAYLSLRLSVGTIAKTRVAIDPTQTGREEEQTVQEIRMVLYELNNNTAKYVWDLQAWSNPSSSQFEGQDVSQEPGNINTLSRFVTVGKPVAKQDYKMLILVNPPQRLKEVTEKGKSIGELNIPFAINDRTELTNPDGVAEDNRFFMTNHQGFIDVPEMELQTSQQLAEQNPKYVQVERAVSKVVISDNIPYLPNNDEIINLKWDLDVTNQKSFWMRKMARLSYGSMESPNDGSDRYDRYAEDPNFSGFSAWNHGSPDGEFELLNYPFPVLTKEFGDANYAYALENTMEAEEQRHDVTTRVVISGNYIPYFPSVATRASTPINFFTFAGYTFKENDMVNYANNPSYIPEELRTLGLEMAIQNVKNERGANAFTNLTESFSSNGINFYLDGLCYYTVLIRHFNDGQVPTLMDYGRYGVVRNNVYRLTIRNIIGPGQPVIDKPGTDPDDDDTWVAADIEMLPWYVRNQEVEDL